jgi:hypothetical protein
MKLGNTDIQSLEGKFSHKKSIPEMHYDIIILALSHYPELLETHIEFANSRGDSHFVKTELTSFNIYASRYKRKYTIKLYNSEKNEYGFQSLSTEARIGAVARELALIDICNSIALRTFIKRILFYLHQYKNSSIESEIDHSLVKHGLATQLLAYSKHIEAISQGKSLHKPTLSPKEIVSLQNGQLGL